MDFDVQNNTVKRRQINRIAYVGGAKRSTEERGSGGYISRISPNRSKGLTKKFAFLYRWVNRKSLHIGAEFK